MTEGGECTLDKFSALDNSNGTDFLKNSNIGASHEFGSLRNERCVRLRPWMAVSTPFAFHFKFVRRPRRFSDPEAESRFIRRRRRLGRQATREVGQVSLRGNIFLIKYFNSI